MSRTGRGGDGNYQPQARPEICEYGDGCTRRVVGKNSDFLYVCSAHMRSGLNRPSQFFLEKAAAAPAPATSPLSTKPLFIKPLPAKPVPSTDIAPVPPAEEQPRSDLTGIFPVRTGRVGRPKKNHAEGKAVYRLKAVRPIRALEVNPNPEPGGCKIIGCVKEAHSRGLCSACYMVAHSRGLLEQVGDPEKLRGRNGFFREVEAIIRDNPGITWKQIMEKTGHSKPDVGAAVGYLRQHGRVAKGAGAGPYYGQCFISGTEPY